MTQKLHLAVSALGKRVYVGRINKAGNCFLDGKQDVTNDFFKAVVDYFHGHEGGHETEIVGDGRKWKVICQEVSNG